MKGTPQVRHGNLLLNNGLDVFEFWGKEKLDS